MNVWGDSVGAGIVESLSLGQLSKMDDEEITEKHSAEKSQNGELNHGYEDQTFFNTSL